MAAIENTKSNVQAFKRIHSGRLELPAPRV